MNKEFFDLSGTGSSSEGSPAGPEDTTGGAGKSTQSESTGQPDTQEGVDYEALYQDLEKRFGAQGNELGEYRKFFQSIAPILDKLEESPEVVQAILDGKINAEVAKAIMEGKISIEDAETVTEAHEEVKKEVGKEKYETLTQEQVEKLVEEKAKELRREIEDKTELQQFEEKTQKFIESTPDFADYAEAIDEWLDQHDVADIEIAYWAVKGKMSEAEAKKKAEEEAAENAKKLAMNAAGGGTPVTQTVESKELIDSLISGRPNPNVL